MIRIFIIYDSPPPPGVSPPFPAPCVCPSPVPRPRSRPKCLLFHSLQTSIIHGEQARNVGSAWHRVTSQPEQSSIPRQRFQISFADLGKTKEPI